MTNSLCVVFKLKPPYKKLKMLKIPLIKIINKKITRQQCRCHMRPVIELTGSSTFFFIYSMSYSWAILSDDREFALKLFFLSNAPRHLTVSRLASKRSLTRNRSRCWRGNLRFLDLQSNVLLTTLCRRMERNTVKS